MEGGGSVFGVGINVLEGSTKNEVPVVGAGLFAVGVAGNSILVQLGLEAMSRVSQVPKQGWGIVSSLLERFPFKTTPSRTSNMLTSLRRAVGQWLFFCQLAWTLQTRL